MNQDKILSELIALAEQLGFEIREEKGDFNGGLCRVMEDKYLFLNRMHNRDQQIAVMAEALAKQPLDGVYLLPAVRELLESRGRLAATSPPGEE